MTAVRALRSTTYGAKLFAYLLVVAGIGAALLGVGYSLAWPEITAAGPLPGAVENTATVAAGAAAGGLGGFLIGSAVLGGLYKAVADGVAAGRVAQPLGAEPAPVVENDAEETPATEEGTTTAEPAAGAGDEDPGPEPDGSEGPSPEAVPDQPATADSEPTLEQPAGADAADPVGTDEPATEAGEGATAATGVQESTAAETPATQQPADDGAAPTEVETVEAGAGEASEGSPGEKPEAARADTADAEPAEMSPGEIAFGSTDDGPDPADTDPAEWFDTEPETDEDEPTGDGGVFTAGEESGDTDVGSVDGSAGTDRKPASGSASEEGPDPSGQEGVDQVEEPAGTSNDRSESVEPAGSSAPADPLADLRDEE